MCRQARCRPLQASPTEWLAWSSPGSYPL